MFRSLVLIRTGVTPLRLRTTIRAPNSIVGQVTTIARTRNLSGCDKTTFTQDYNTSRIHQTSRKMSSATSTSSTMPGIHLSNGSTIVHGTGINKKTVFTELGFPVTMNELYPGKTISFGGQLGLIDFDTSTRLPRHVHIYEGKFIYERILVLEGYALVEMNGEIYVIPPRTLVTIAPGVPHTWTACPKGIRLDRVFEGEEGVGGEKESTGSFLMVYEYEEPTSFCPTRQTETLGDVSEYVACEEGGLEEIRIPELSREQVLERAWFVYNKAVKKAK